MLTERITRIKVPFRNQPARQFKGKKILIVSKRGSGKSWLAEAIALSLPREPEDKFVVVSPTDKLHRFWVCRLDRCDVLHDPKTIPTATPSTDPAQAGPYPYGCVILDDCAPSNPSAEWIDGVGHLLMNPQLTLVVTTQFLSLESELVDLFDYVMIGEEDYACDRRRLHERISTGLDYDTFDQQMSSICDFEFMMVNTKARVPTSEDDPGLRTVDFADAGIRAGDHILVINRDDEYTTRFVRGVIGHLQPEDLHIVNRFGQNRYDFVPAVYDASASALASASDSVSEMFNRILSPSNETRKKLLVVEYALHKLMYFPAFSEILRNGRHYGITLVVVERGPPVLIGPELRGNFDRVVIGRFIDNGPLRRVYDHYCGLLPDHSVLESLSGHIDSDRALMIDKRIRSTSLEDKIFYLTLFRIPTTVSSSETTAPTRRPTLEDIMRYLQEMDRKVERVIAHVEQGTRLCPDR